MTVPPFRKGDDIFVFYRADKACQHHRKYVACLDPRHGAYRPRTGLSEGWVPARVVLDHDASKRPGEVCIEYRWPHFYTMRGHIVNTRSSYTEWYRLGHVMRCCPGEGAVTSTTMLPPDFRPELSLILFRWGGKDEIHAAEQWGETGSSVSDKFFESFMDMAVYPSLGTSYEVWTVYIEDHSDMMKIAESAHLIFGANHPARRARRTCGIYMLYPTPFEEGCVPTAETGGDNGAGLIDQKSFFQMMKAVERAGIPSRFPHCSALYEQLASKRWTHQMSLAPHLRVPPTVAVPRMLVERSCSEAADKGLASLNMVKQQQAALRGETEEEGGITKGVLKLGFSWEALDVKLWHGRNGLREALYQLSQAIEISDELTGQPHDCDSLLLQEFVPHDLELRIYTVNGEVEGMIFTKFCSVKPNNEFGDFKQTFNKFDAAKRWMGGDVAALSDGEEQCRQLTAHWLKWVQAQSCEVPAGIRFDYFVRRGAEAGTAEVWTLEICELGFSMLGEKRLPGKVFGAMLQSCLELEEHGSGSAPEPHAKRPRF